MAAAVGFTNHFDAATLTGGGAVSTLPLQNMQQAQLRKPYRTIGTSAWAQADLGGIKAIDVVAMAGTNLTASAQRRVQIGSKAITNLIAYSEDFTNAWFNKQGVAAASAAGTAPPVGALPTSTACSITTTRNTSNTVIYHPSNPLAVTGNVAAWTFWVKAVSNIQWIACNLCGAAGESNQIRQWFDIVNGVKGTFSNFGSVTGITSTITSAGNGWWRIDMAGTWPSNPANWATLIFMCPSDASEAAASTIGAQMLLFGWEVFEAASPYPGYVATSGAAASGLVADLYDSTWEPGLVDPNFNGNTIELMPSTLQGRYVRIDAYDASLSWVDLGRGIVMPLWKPSRLIAAGNQMGYVTRDDRVRSPWGPLYTRARARPRAMQVPFQYLTEAEFMGNALELDRTVGAASDILVIRDTSNPVQQNWLWGMPTDVSPPTNPFVRRWHKTFDVVERL